jgi:hypothetical protein
VDYGKFYVERTDAERARDLEAPDVTGEDLTISAKKSAAEAAGAIVVSEEHIAPQVDTTVDL